MKGEDSKNLIIENPSFHPFSFRESGMAGRVDDSSTRYAFDCHFRDIVANTEGRVKSLIVFNDKREAYFESFTVFMEKPIDKIVRVMETKITNEEKEIPGFKK